MGNSPGWSYSFVPTAAQWNEAFALKQDELGYAPVNRNGDTMLGRFVTFASTPDRAGFNVQPGVAPTLPAEGDIWFTTTGIYAFVGGNTIGPISTGTVTSVGLSAPAEFTVSGSPVTGTGSLTFAWANKAANLVLAGPGNGADAAPAFRALVGADLPDPGASTKGGVKSKAVVTNQFLTSIGTDGTPASAQPSFGNLIGQATAAQLGTGVAVSNIGFTPAGLTSNSFTGAQKWAKGANLASAASLTLGTDGNLFHVTGTTTITAISGSASPATLVFDGALTLTHNGTSLILPGGANIATAAGDVAVFVNDGGSNWRCVSYIKAAGLGLNNPEVLALFNASGSAPVYAPRAWVNFNGTGTVAIRASGNVSSITDNGTGDYTVNFTTAMADANYSASVTAQTSTGGGVYDNAGIKEGVAPTASALRVTTSNNTGVLRDALIVCVVVNR